MAEQFTGARARFFIDGIPVAYATDVSGGESYQYDELHVLGLLEIAEHVVVGYGASLRARLFRRLRESVKALGIFPRLRDVLTSGVMTAAIQDIPTGLTPYQFIGVRAAGRSFDTAARSSVGEDVDFVCIRAIDESERQ